MAIKLYVLKSISNVFPIIHAKLALPTAGNVVAAVTSLPTYPPSTIGMCILLTVPEKNIYEC